MAFFQVEAEEEESSEEDDDEDESSEEEVHREIWDQFNETFSANFLQLLMALSRPTQYSIPCTRVKAGQGDYLSDKGVEFDP
jgi:hypothetical protein